MYMYNVLLFYTTYISADLAHHDAFRAKFDKGGINIVMQKKISIFMPSTVCVHAIKDGYGESARMQWLA